MILVTGAAGFIGSHLVDRLLADGHEVLGLDDFDPFYPAETKRENLRDASKHPRFRLIDADLCEPETWTDLAEILESRCRCIVHLAAKAGVRPSLADPIGYHATNLTGTLRLLEFARHHGNPHVVLASSSSVYGVNSRVPWREDDHDLQPISPYASSKLAMEQAARVYASAYGQRIVALRFFTVYGPRQRPDLAIAKFARRMRAGLPIPVFGDGSTRRDYTFVDDIVDGIVRAMRYDASPFEVINLGNHRTVSLREMIDTLADVFGIDPILEELPPQTGDVPQTWADVTRASRLLGWKPKTDFASGIRAYKSWLDTCREQGAKAPSELVP
ncbi:GDP-mannose 4,6-dehydratase [Opitutales bacterium ASA1]|uniref:NAD-dependent epimerase/dehydratase family protein n=1 Tax=Congregicoccus parvus TaxID=3081749 RepID=UPI002B2D28D0|nr:GDP-mannose 4,6-dehydratase [Opitutales bacterium ASA1]